MEMTINNNGASAARASVNAVVVESNSVQSQFAALTRDRDALRNATDGANRNRRLQENAIQSLRQTQTALAEQIRVAHATLGVETKKREMLQNEKDRLSKQFHHERHVELSSLNTELKQLEQEERQRKMAFVKEMDLMNDDLNEALVQQKEHGLVELISIESAEYLLEMLNKNDMENNNKSSNLQNAMQDSLELLQEATMKLQREKETMMALDEDAHTLRGQALQGRGTTEAGSVPLGELELNELERLWETSWDEHHHHHNHDGSMTNPAMTTQEQQQQPVHMNLFYGTSAVGDDDIVMTQDENDHSTANHMVCDDVMMATEHETEKDTATTVMEQ